MKNGSDRSNNTVARSARTVSLAVMGSRVLGLVREQVLAALFGASREFDAFITAFRIPNLLRDLYAEGALSAAFVTTFTKKLTAELTVRAGKVVYDHNGMASPEWSTLWMTSCWCLTVSNSIRSYAGSTLFPRSPFAGWT